MNNSVTDGSDQRSELTTTTALLVDPVKRSVQAVARNRYEGIQALFAEKYHTASAFLPEIDIRGNTICKVAGNIYLHSWGDGNLFLTAPAWRTSFAPGMSMHGLTVIDAYDMSTGERVDCPASPEQFAMTIQWEDSAARRDPRRPNREWADKGGYHWSVSDGKGGVYAEDLPGRMNRKVATKQRRR